MSLFPEDAPYRVLARKYRPGDFDALIGQDAVVTTLGNAIGTNRLAQAWLLTGVRGVGKTSTARIIAKALNCVGLDGNGGPTIHPCGECSNCTAITAGQHIDVVEIDGASNNGVDDVREIIEAVRYSASQARYKIYIIDEVHMVTKAAFNALLKTLEEPPPHVKFIFATTEVNKVPATILSRCQRFDLKRVPAELLAAHFAKVSAAEGIEAEPEALALIARAAEGSVRDGLSILDQAIALSAPGPVTAAAVRDMLGLAERGRIAGLLGAMLDGDAAMALAAMDAAHADGVEPQALISGLLDLVHSISRAKLASSADPALPEGDRALVAQWAAQLSFPAIHRLWQLLLKGHGDIARAPIPQQAAEMAILRCVHAAGMPDPEKLAKMLTEGGDFAPLQISQAGPGHASAAQPASASALPSALPAAIPAPANIAPAAPPAISDAQGLVQLFTEKCEAMLAHQLHDNVGIVSVSAGKLTMSQLAPLPTSFAADIRRLLDEWTGAEWNVTLTGPVPGAESLRQAQLRHEAAIREAALANPMVAALMAEFPGATLEVQPSDEEAETVAHFPYRSATG